MRLSLKARGNKRIFTLAMAIILILVTPVLAFASYFDGTYSQPGTTINGAYAIIGTAKYPVVYNNSASAWSMASNSSSANKFVQVGWIDRYSYGTSFFFEWANSDIDCGRIFNQYTPAQDSKHEYKVYLNSNNLWYGTEDGATIGTVSTTQLTWTPNQVVYSGEIADYNEAFPGQTNDHVSFTSVQYNNGSVWLTPNLSQLTPATDAGFAFNGSTAFDIWDQRY